MAASMRRPRWAAASIALVAIAGCGGQDRPEPRRAAAAEPPPAERLDLGVVSVTARVGRDVVRSAGAVYDAERGLVLTTAHSVWGARSLKVGTGIAVLHGRIVARDACDDLAVLETQPRLPGLVALRPSADGTLPTGRPIVAVRRRAGLPASGPELTTQRVVLAERAAGSLVPGVRPRGAVAIAVARTLPPEATGSPLIGADGRLAALAQVVEHGSGTARAALPWATIAARLRELRPGGRAQYVGWRRHYRCAAALHRHAAARHPGFHVADARLNVPVPATRLPGTQEVDG
jgi:S1-C subfamily serine protease